MNTKTIFRIPFSFICLAALALIFCGCGNDKGLIRLTGKITLDGSEMPYAGEIKFLPKEVEAGKPMRPARAKFDTGGAFRATSFKPGDGIYPGNYAVTVECWEVAASMGGPAPVNAIDRKYQDPANSGLNLVVEPNKSNQVFDIKLSSPASK